MSKKIWVGVAVVIIVVITIVTIAIFSHGRKKDTTIIKIGVIIPLTGEVATYGQSLRRGLELASGSEKGKSFDFIYEDSMADKRTAINALEKLFFSKVKYFIGDATSSVTYEIGPRIQAENGVLMVPIATGDRIKCIGENIFMLSPRNEKQTHRIANFIKNNFDDKKIGCLFKQNDYGVNIANTFLKLFKDETYSQAYQEGQNDFRSLLLKFNTEAVDLVFLPGNYEETAIILKQARQINYNAVFIGTDGAYSPKLIESAREASEGFLLTMMPVDYQSKMYLEFEKQYLEKNNNTKPDIFACYGYESGLIMMEAINSSPNNTPEEVIEHLQSHKFDSLTGMMNFENEGDPNQPGWEANRDYGVYVVQDGKFIPYDLAVN